MALLFLLDSYNFQLKLHYSPPNTPTLTPVHTLTTDPNESSMDSLLQQLIKQQRFAEALSCNKYIEDLANLDKQMLLYEQAKREDRLLDAIEIKKVCDLIHTFPNYAGYNYFEDNNRARGIKIAAMA